MTSFSELGVTSLLCTQRGQFVFHFSPFDSDDKQTNRTELYSL